MRKINPPTPPFFKATYQFNTRVTEHLRLTKYKDDLDKGLLIQFYS